MLDLENFKIKDDIYLIFDKCHHGFEIYNGLQVTIE